jgi:hypothetical protein
MRRTPTKAGRSGIERSSCLVISTPPLQFRRRRLMWFGGGLGIHRREARHRVRRCLGDNCPSSAQTGPVGSRQLRLVDDSGESGLVGCSSGLWNDRENDHLSKRSSGSGASGLRPSPAIIPITEPRSRCANRKLRGQAYPSLATTSGSQPNVSQPEDCGGCATLIWDMDSGHRQRAPAHDGRWPCCSGTADLPRGDRSSVHGWAAAVARRPGG